MGGEIGILQCNYSLVGPEKLPNLLQTKEINPKSGFLFHQIVHERGQFLASEDNLSPPYGINESLREPVTAAKLPSTSCYYLKTTFSGTTSLDKEKSIIHTMPQTSRQPSITCCKQ